MNTTTLLGISQITSHKEILATLQLHNVTPIFYEQDHFIKNWNQSISIFPMGEVFPKSPFFIFSEYWLTKLMQETNITKSFVQISENALKACRSKLFFSTLLEEKNIPCVHREKVSKRPDDYLSQGVIIRPDCAYSGKGVKHINNKVTYSQYLLNISFELSPTMKIVMGAQNITYIEEEYLDGEEYSCDVIISPFGRKVLRVCYKKVKWINSYPCPVAYITVPLSNEMQNAILSWCNVLFNQTDNLSFAQFDFIKKEDGTFIPIDFSARPGGGLNSLLSLALSNQNLYAEAICFALGKTASLPYPLPLMAQFSVLAEHPGKLSDISITWPNAYKSIMNFNLGDEIPKQTLSSASARIVSVISPVSSLAEFSEMSEHIHDYVKISLE